MSDATESVIGVDAPAPTRRYSLGVVVISTVATLAAGVGGAVQTSLNGHLAVMIGSPVLATALNHAGGLAAGLVVALAIGSFPRAWRSLRARRAEIKWWWFLGGFMGFAIVMTIISLTAQVGVVTIAVALTLGQLAGSVIADSAALGPGGRRRLNTLRVLGIVVALAAVTIGSIGRLDPGNLFAILLIVAGGILAAIQQSANGWVVVVTGGEWATMTVINFVAAGLGTGTVLLIQTLIAPPAFHAIPWWAPLGGVTGAAVGVALAIGVRTIGVLITMLCFAAGQAIAAILVDLFAPVDAVGVTVGSIIGALLAVLAVALAGLGSLPRRTPRATPDRAPDPVPQ